MSKGHTASWLATGLCLTLALAAHLPFWVLVDPVLSRPGYPYSSPPRFSVRPVVNNDQSMAPWSPILFSLPTPAGFSGETPNEPKKLSPPLQGLPLKDLLLERPPQPPHQNSIARYTVPVGPRPTSSPKHISYRPSQPKGWQLRFPGPLQRADFVQAEIPGLERFALDATVRVWLQINKEGLVSQLFLEDSSGDADLDATVLRALYGWRAQPSTEQRAGPVELRLQQRKRS